MFCFRLRNFTKSTNLISLLLAMGQLVEKLSNLYLASFVNKNPPSWFTGEIFYCLYSRLGYCEQFRKHLLVAWIEQLLLMQ